MSKRKHVKQMSPEEQETVIRAINSFHVSYSLKFKEHTYYRMKQKGITSKDIVDTIKFGKIVEVHNKVRNDIRVLLRLRRKKESICVVFSLREGTAITAYKNDRSDNHYTIDWSEYKWKANLCSGVKRFMTRYHRGAM